MSTDGHRTLWRRNISENFNRLSRAHERHRRQTDDRRQTTDGPTITYSEHELEFTFAKNNERNKQHRMTKKQLVLRKKNRQTREYTRRLQNRKPIFMAVISSNLNRLSTFSHRWEACKDFQQNPYNISHHTLNTLLHHLEMLKRSNLSQITMRFNERQPPQSWCC